MPGGNLTLCFEASAWIAAAFAGKPSLETNFLHKKTSLLISFFSHNFFIFIHFYSILFLFILFAPHQILRA